MGGLERQLVLPPHPLPPFPFCKNVSNQRAGWKDNFFYPPSSYPILQKGFQPFLNFSIRIYNENHFEHFLSIISIILYHIQPDHIRINEEMKGIGPEN